MLKCFNTSNITIRNIPQSSVILNSRGKQYFFIDIEMNWKPSHHETCILSNTSEVASRNLLVAFYNLFSIVVCRNILMNSGVDGVSAGCLWGSEMVSLHFLHFFNKKTKTLYNFFLNIVKNVRSGNEGTVLHNGNE